MKPYLFVFRVKQSRDNPQNQAIEGAYATVIVFRDSSESARSIAINYLEEYGWHIEWQKHALELLPSQIADLDASLKSVYQKAELNGISSYFDCFPLAPDH